MLKARKHFFKKPVIFRILRIFRGLLPTKSVKKYIQPGYRDNHKMKRTINLMKRKMKKLQSTLKKIPYVQVKNDSSNLENNFKMSQRRIQN